jgi:predicted acyltransferase
MLTAEEGVKRIVSLDQFRGYTVLGMFLVNFVGSFQATHYLLKHHNTFCSYADTIMPQFFFAVGFAFRLTFRRRIESGKTAAAYLRVIHRFLGLALVALIVYAAGDVARTWADLTSKGVWEALRVPLKRTWFQTLMHIAVTSLWVLPVIRRGAKTRIAFMLGSAGLHVYLSFLFNFQWVNNGDPNAIDGGPLGFLTWTIPMIVGTLACDIITREDGRWRMLPLIAWSIVLMVLGYAFSCGTRLYDVPASQFEDFSAQKFATHPVVPDSEQISIARENYAAGQWSQLVAEPPFVAPPHQKNKISRSYRWRKWNYWMMSQRSGTLSYLTFSAGFAMAVYVLFYFICDCCGWQMGVLRTFGTNALVAYILHGMVDSAIKPFVPRDAPVWYTWAGCAVFIGITYLMVRSLERRNIYLKL